MPELAGRAEGLVVAGDGFEAPAGASEGALGCEGGFEGFDFGGLVFGATTMMGFGGGWFLQR